MSARHRTRSEREQLELFRALPGDLAPRDAQDLMAYPFFSLAKTHRMTPIDYRMNDISVRVEAVPEHGMATIWDADVLIWAASQIVQAMIVALLNQKGGVGKTALALHPAGQSARQGKRITLIDADPQGSVLGWSEQRARRRFDRLLGVIGLARDTLHREAPELARHSDQTVIDCPPHVAALLSSALLSDLALILAQPSPVDGLESAEMLALIAEARVFRPAVRARFVLNLCPARTIIARETAQGPRRARSAGARGTDRPTHNLRGSGATRSARIRTRRRRSRRARDRGAGPRIRPAVAVTTRSRNGGFAARPRDAKSWIRSADPFSSASVSPDLYSTRLTIDVTPALRGRQKIDALQRAATVADMRRDLLAREFSYTDGDRL